MTNKLYIQQYLHYVKTKLLLKLYLENKHALVTKRKKHYK